MNTGPTYEVLNGDEPRLPPADPRYVQRVDDRRPQELEREGPVGEAEPGLLLVAHLPVRQDERDGGRETERDALRGNVAFCLHFQLQIQAGESEYYAETLFRSDSTGDNYGPIQSLIQVFLDLNCNAIHNFKLKKKCVSDQKCHPVHS